MRRAMAAAVLAAALAVGAASAGAVFPSKINLPNGFAPEGIATAGQTFYVGSIPTGAVYRGNLRTGQGSVFVQPVQGRQAIGMDVDRGLLFVAGGPTGKGFVYDARTASLVQELQLSDPATGSSFVNDVVVTKRSAWFTDSFKPVLYRVPLASSGRPSGAPVAESLTGDYQHGANFNVNGIDATPNGKTLVIVQSNTGRLFTVAPSSGQASQIDLGTESVPNGDGIHLDGKTLYVVQNQLNTIAKIALRPDLSSGRVVRRITSPDFSVPTTIDEHGANLYAVNARFGTPVTPDTPYWLTRVRK